MQRSSVGFIGCLWKQPKAAARVLLKNSRLTSRQMAYYDSSKTSKRGSGKTIGSSSSSSSSSGGSSSNSNQGSSSKVNTRTDLAGQGHVRREANMWSDPQRLDAKWLRPCDPRRYKPDFVQIEPQSLRKQFMRSPDERTRDAMGHDWEMNMRFANNSRRQVSMAKLWREKDSLSKRIFHEQQHQKQQQLQKLPNNQMAKNANRD